MKFNVPYYHQTSEFTCGPACVLMVMKHFDPRIALTRQLEFEIWRNCNMIGTKGADPFGLAVPLIDAGFEVRLTTERRTMANTKRWKRRLVRAGFTSQDAELSIFGIRQNKLRALSRSLPIQYKQPKVQDIASGVDAGYVPIALVHMGVVHSLNIPHWVVVTDAHEESVVFNDPYPPKGRKGLRLSKVKFQEILDNIGIKIGMSPSVLFVRNG
ncbi:MAG TPA: peptidase C39 family protein [Methylomirabilota bacterium]|nr:peptidase C39 family protein [Methylomirabilota bacterium]